MRFFSFALGRVTIQWKLEMKWILLSDGIRLWCDTLNWFNIVCATIVKTKIVSNVSAASNIHSHSACGNHLVSVSNWPRLGNAFISNIDLSFSLESSLDFSSNKKCCRVTGRCLMYWKRYFHHMHTRRLWFFTNIELYSLFSMCSIVVFESVRLHYEFKSLRFDCLMEIKRKQQQHKKSKWKLDKIRVF